MENYLKVIRKAKDLTLDALEAKSGVGASTIGNFENGKTNMSDESLKKIANALQVPVSEILKKNVVGNATDPFLYKMHVAPLVSWARGGTGYEYIEQEGELPMVPTDCDDPKCYALKLEGDSMEPKYSTGDILILSPSHEARTGKLVVAKTKKGDVLFKIFSRGSGDTIKLISYNDKFPIIELKLSEMEWIYPVHSVVREFTG